jgi:predicted nucleic acid-binding protein
VDHFGFDRGRADQGNPGSRARRITRRAIGAGQVGPFEIDPVIRSTAAAYADPALRSLDAIHLATAQTAASTARLTALVTYDNRLSAAASALGITTVAPGNTP